MGIFFVHEAFSASAPNDKFIIKISVAPANNSALLDSWSLSKKLSDSGAKHWAKILQIGVGEDGLAYCVMPAYESSVAKLLEMKVALTFADAATLANGIIAGLEELKNAFSRQHGGLSVGNVILHRVSDFAGIGAFNVLLSDPLAEHQKNLFDSDESFFAKFFYLHSKVASPETLIPAEIHSGELGGFSDANAERFCSFFNRYVSSQKSFSETVDFDALRREISLLSSARKKIPAYYFAFIAVAFAVLVLISQKDSIMRRIQGVSKYDRIKVDSEWNEYSTAYFEWFGEFTRALFSDKNSPVIQDEYFKDNITSAILAVVKNSPMEFDPRYKTLGNLDDWGAEDLREYSRFAPDSLFNDAQKVQHLFALLKTLRHTRESIAQWKELGESQEILQFFEKANLDLLTEKERHYMQSEFRFDSDIWLRINFLKQKNEALKDIKNIHKSLIEKIKYFKESEDPFLVRIDSAFVKQELDGVSGVENLNIRMRRLENDFSKVEKFYTTKLLAGNFRLDLFRKHGSSYRENVQINVLAFESWMRESSGYEPISSLIIEKKLSAWKTDLASLQKMMSLVSSASSATLSEIKIRIEGIDKLIVEYSQAELYEGNRAAILAMAKKVDFEIESLNISLKRNLSAQNSDIKEAVSAWFDSLAQSDVFVKNSAFSEILERERMRIVGNRSKDYYIKNVREFFDARKEFDMIQDYLRDLNKRDFLSEYTLKKHDVSEALHGKLADFINRSNEIYKREIVFALAKFKDGNPLVAIDESGTLKDVVSLKKQYENFVSAINSIAETYVKIRKDAASGSYDSMQLQDKLAALFENSVFTNGFLSKDLFIQGIPQLKEFENIAKIKNRDELLSKYFTAANENSSSVILAWQSLCDKIIAGEYQSFAPAEFYELYERVSAFLNVEERIKIKEIKKRMLTHNMEKSANIEEFGAWFEHAKKLPVAVSDFNAGLIIKSKIYESYKQINSYGASKLSDTEVTVLIADLKAYLSKEEFKDIVFAELLLKDLGESDFNVKGNQIDIGEIGPAQAGWKIIISTDEKIEYGYENLRLAFHKITTGEGDFYLSETEVSADVFIKWTDSRKLWKSFAPELPECVKNYDIFDSRSGPRTWIPISSGQMRLRASRETWLELPPTWVDIQFIAPDVSLGDDAFLPMQYLSTRLAESFAQSLGCTLPNKSAYLTAFNFEKRDNVQEWNLPDRSLAEQRTHIEELQKSKRLEYLQHDGDSYGKYFTSKNYASNSVETNDGTVWFESVEKQRGKKFKHLWGNVGEFVADGNLYYVTGNSAMSLVGLGEEFFEIKDSAMPLEFSDVGFRLMFSAPNLSLGSKLLNLLKTSFSRKN